MNFKCERCCRCCSDPSLFVIVTHRDILRLEFFLPGVDLFKILGFYQIADNDKSLEKRLMTPSIITNNGKIFLGLQKRADKCIFLDNKECRIYDCRPQICRAFPYTFQKRVDEIYWGFAFKAKEYCPAIKKEPEVNRKELYLLASELLKESEEFRQLVRIWNHLAQNNLIDPTLELLLQFFTGKIKLKIEDLEKFEKIN